MDPIPTHLSQNGGRSRHDFRTERDEAPLLRPARHVLHERLRLCGGDEALADRIRAKQVKNQSCARWIEITKDVVQEKDWFQAEPILQIEVLRQAQRHSECPVLPLRRISPNFASVEAEHELVPMRSEHRATGLPFAGRGSLQLAPQHFRHHTFVSIISRSKGLIRDRRSLDVVSQQCVCPGQIPAKRVYEGRPAKGDPCGECDVLRRPGEENRLE